MKEEILLNKIYVLQSLPAEERQTGTELYDDLLQRKIMQLPGFHADLCNFQDRKGFEQIMSVIKKNCSPDGMRPYLHFELHGNKEGLVTNENELLSWELLYEHFVGINRILVNQLFVSLASCFGAYFFQVINPLRPSPVFAFIGPPKVMLADDIAVGFYEYFDTLLLEKDINRAIEALNKANPGAPDYVFESSLYIFDKVANDFMAIYTNRASKRNKIETLMKTAWKNHEIRKSHSKESLREHFKNDLSNRPLFIQRMREYFCHRRSNADFLIP